MKRKALGKGLRSLIPQPPPGAAAGAARAGKPAPGAGLRHLDVDKIHPSRGQPRRHFDQRNLEDLARSLERDGVLQPIIVRPYRNDEFELVAGERRWRAAQIAGLLKVPAVVMDVSEDRLLELALVENLQREELNPIEEANAYQTLIDQMGLTQEEVGRRVGKKRATITNALRLLNLPIAVQEKIEQGLLTAGHAKALAALTRSQAQVELAERIVREDLSVRQAESLVARSTRGPSSKQAPKLPERDPNVVAAEENLQRAIGTKVRIVQGRKGGRLEVHYYSDEELERVYELILAGAKKA